MMLETGLLVGTIVFLIGQFSCVMYKLGKLEARIEDLRRIVLNHSVCGEEGDDGGQAS